MEEIEGGPKTLLNLIRKITLYRSHRYQVGLRAEIEENVSISLNPTDLETERTQS